MQVIGTCGACGGRVSVPAVWSGMYPPTPQCQSCGRETANRYGPVIPMESAPKRQPFEAIPDWLEGA